MNQRPEAGLLLDEMFSPAIAAELSKLGHDVIAVADRPDLRSKSDEEIREVMRLIERDLEPVFGKGWLKGR